MAKKTTSSNPKAVQIDINLDQTPIFYTENIFISSSPYGINLDFAQKLGPTNKMRIVSRIGMSREQAKKLLQELGKTLAITEAVKKKN